ncbi:MAG: acetyl-CoA carboxylase biotin carboxyl carrier protein subunit [Bacteroidetes bacterium]|nr:acetyl-CoA carboxylase biotin carboxyl carrier protein subunit [Bacteroidota bacterium]
MWSINGKSIDTSKGAAIAWENHQFFTLEYQGKIYHGEILENNIESNMIKLKLNHAIYEVRKKGNLDDLIASLGMDKPKVKRIKELQAPMPGRILQLFVVAGQDVGVGDSILSLEAMKMENVLKSDGIGIVKKIQFEIGDVVDKGAVLIEFE